jgi:hypothetical protein
LGSEFDDWVYWHLFTNTVDYNSSHIELLLNDVCLTELSEEFFTALNESECYVTTDSQSAILSWNKAPFLGLRPDIYYCLTVAGLLIWGTLSDESMVLSFTIAAGPRQRSHFRVRVPWDSWPYFTVSDSRFPFSSPPTTRRFTVDVFNAASTRVCIECTNELPFITARRPEYKSPCRTFNCTLLLCWLSWKSRAWQFAPGDDSFVAIRCSGNVISEPLLSNRRLIRLHHLGFQPSCHNIASYGREARITNWEVRTLNKDRRTAGYTCFNIKWNLDIMKE